MGPNVCAPLARLSFLHSNMDQVVRKIRGFIRVSAAIYAAVVLAAFLLFSFFAREKYQTLALEEARTLNEAIVAMQSWNASHDGVYVLSSDRLQPNPYLADPNRDVVTAEGLRLTKLNPAFMTRLVSEHVRQESGVFVHLTSLKPLRPENSADAWEKQALEEIERSRNSVWTIEESGSGEVFRYIEGVSVEEPCLNCHAEQGHKVGDVRGGLSVTIPYARFSRLMETELVDLAIAHLLFLVLGLGPLLFMGARLARTTEKLEQVKERVEGLEGLLPVCSFCKRIRRSRKDNRNQEEWYSVDRFLAERGNMDITHSICPECMEREYPED